MSQPKLSFTIRRPTPSSAAGTPHTSRAPSTGPSSGSDDPPASAAAAAANGRPVLRAASSFGAPVPSPLAGHKRRFQASAHAGSSDEEDGTEDEIITGFDELGVERPIAHRNAASSGPLVIPVRPNKDWRQHSGVKRRVVDRYLPPGAGPVGVGEDGSQGGLGTRDTINSGPQDAGLKFFERREETKTEVVAADGAMKSEEALTETDVKMEVEEESLEQRALRALLQGDEPSGPTIGAIPLKQDEAESYKEDVAARPDTPTMDDYARVPIEQFGAALLRGMGWVEGAAASRTRKGMDKPYVPVARQALLGLGAKPRPEDTIVQTGRGRGQQLPKRPERRYVPVVKRVAEVREGNGSASGTPSAKTSDDEGRRRDRDKDQPPHDREPRRHRDDGRYSDREERKERQPSDRGWESDRPSSRDKDKARDKDGDRDADRYRRDDRRYDDRGSRRDRDDDRDRDRERDRRR